MTSGHPIKNCFECSGSSEMKEICPLFYAIKKNPICSYRMVCDNDWVKYLNGEKNITLKKMLEEFVDKFQIDRIPIVNVGQELELSDKISQQVVSSVKDVSGDDLNESRLVLLTEGDFKKEIELTRENGYRGPIAVFNDGFFSISYLKRIGVDESCKTKEDIYKVILKYIA